MNYSNFYTSPEAHRFQQTFYDRGNPIPFHKEPDPIPERPYTHTHFDKENAEEAYRRREEENWRNNLTQKINYILMLLVLILIIVGITVVTTGIVSVRCISLM